MIADNNQAMTVLLTAALLLYLASIFYAVLTFAGSQQTKNSPHWLSFLVGSGFAAHTAYLVLSWISLAHFPIVNIKEICSFIAWAIAGYYLSAVPRHKARALPIVLLSVTFGMTLLSLLLPEQQASEAMVNIITASTFTRIIFPVHVTMLILSYAAFVVTLAGGIMYLIQERELKAKRFGAAFKWLPALNTCDEIGYRSLTIGFVMLTLGMVTGMMWGKQHDGRFWHNDPKEVMALVTWIVYLGIMHYRLTAGWRGRRVAWMAIGGFVAVLMTFIGARAMGGYHVFG
jgi:cytochrome c-type biogenesis protein CcsB